MTPSHCCHPVWGTDFHLSGADLPQERRPLQDQDLSTTPAYNRQDLSKRPREGSGRDVCCVWVASYSFLNLNLSGYPVHTVLTSLKNMASGGHRTSGQGQSG